MNLVEIKDCLNPHGLCEKILSTKIYKTLEVCERSENLMVFIYLIEKDNFLYCNRNLKRIFGKFYKRLWNDGWDFWLSRIDEREAAIIGDRIRNFMTGPHREKTLNSHYHITNFEEDKIYLEHEIFLHRTNDQTIAFNYLIDISDKERIENSLDHNNNSKGHGAPKKELGGISAREQEVLRLIANGYSSKEIANMLFISNHTAISHRKNLIEKFRVRNTAHLVKTAAAFI